MGLGPLRTLTARAASLLLGAAGVNHFVSYGAIPIISVLGPLGEVWVDAAIVDLCVGDVELALLPAIILSTFDRSLRRRIVGSLVGVTMILIVNPLRIFTVLWAGSRFDWRVAELMHGFTFRVMLVLIILGFYYIWYLKYDSIAEALNGFTEKTRSILKK